MTMGLRLRAGAVVAIAGLLGGSPAAGEESITRESAPDGARVYFISPADGDVLASPVTVRFGLAGMGVAPAGVGVPKTGHHHVIVDAELPPFDQPVPSDESHRHFGGGQTEVVLELSPGVHTLQLLLGDRNHVPHAPPVVSDRIAITVK